MRLLLLLLLLIPAIPGLHIWTSSLLRTIQTAAHIRGPRRQIPMLDELRSGRLDGFTYEQVEKQFPEDWRAREKNKLGYRYPEGTRFTFCLYTSQ